MVWFTGPEQEKIVCTPAIERTVMADVVIDDLSAAANAHLIAAAPDLLQALQELIAEADAPVGWAGHNGNTAGFDMARAAIAKAEGK